MDEVPPPPPPRQPSYVQDPGPNDVVLGRGSRITNFVGNVRYRQVIRARRVEYMSTGRHRLKNQIAHEIYATIRQRNGQFLEKVPPEELQAMGSREGDVWQPVSEETALRKIKQSLCEDEAAIPRSISVGTNFSSGGANEDTALSPLDRQSMSAQPHRQSGNTSMVPAPPPPFLPGPAVSYPTAANAMMLHEQQQQIQEGTRQLQHLRQQVIHNQLIHERQQLLLTELAHRQQQHQQLRNELSILLAQQQQMHQQHGLLSPPPLLPNNLSAETVLGQLNPLILQAPPSLQPSLSSLVGGATINQQSPSSPSSLLSLMGGASINPQISGILSPTNNGGLALLSSPTSPYQASGNPSSSNATLSSIQQSAVLSNAIIAAAASAAMPNIHSLSNNPQAATAPFHPPSALYGLPPPPPPPPPATPMVPPLSVARPANQIMGGGGGGLSVPTTADFGRRQDNNNVSDTLVSAATSTQHHHDHNNHIFNGADNDNNNNNDESKSETSTTPRCQRPKKKRRKSRS